MITILSLVDELVNCPFILDGAFFTVAVKEGSSELIHLNFNDDLNGITWIVPLDNWKGGKLCVSQLGMKIPICPGQMLGAMTRILAHCSASVKCCRLILTLIVNKTLLKHSWNHWYMTKGENIFIKSINIMHMGLSFSSNSTMQSGPW